MPAGAVSMFGGNANPLAAALRKRADTKTSVSHSNNKSIVLLMKTALYINK